MEHREPVAAGTRAFSCLFERNEDGRYTVTCPSLPGLVTQGDTLAEARAMAREALELYLEVLDADGGPVPEGDQIPERFVEAVLVDSSKV